VEAYRLNITGIILRLDYAYNKFRLGLIQPPKRQRPSCSAFRRWRS